MGLVGLILNFLGSIFIAFSVSENTGAYETGCHFLWHTINIPFAIINLYVFWPGIILLILGFVLQIWERLK